MRTKVFILGACLVFAVSVAVSSAANAAKNKVFPTKIEGLNPPLPVTIDAAARTPIQASLNDSNCGSICGGALFDVPAGMLAHPGIAHGVLVAASPGDTEPAVRRPAHGDWKAVYQRSWDKTTT